MESIHNFNQAPSPVLRKLAADVIDVLADRGDMVARKVRDLICVMQALGLATGDDAERKAEAGENASESKPAAPPSADSGTPAYVNRVKPFMN